MPEGNVKRLNEKKGLGCIEKDGGENVFVHVSAFQTKEFRSFDEGHLVIFDCEKGQKGLSQQIKDHLV